MATFFATMFIYQFCATVSCSVLREEIFMLFLIVTRLGLLTFLILLYYLLITSQTAFEDNMAVLDDFKVINECMAE